MLSVTRAAACRGLAEQHDKACLTMLNAIERARAAANNPSMKPGTPEEAGAAVKAAADLLDGMADLTRTSRLAVKAFRAAAEGREADFDACLRELAGKA